MKKDNKSFADIANSIHAKYYRVRKPGDDKMTDEAFNREMQKLMQKQESIKAQMQPQQSPQESGGMEDYSPQNTQQLMYGIGGNLPKYWGDPSKTSFLNKFNNNGGVYGTPMKYEDSIIGYNPSINTDYSGFGNNAFKTEGFQANITPDVNLKNPNDGIPMEMDPQINKPYSPAANILGPAASIGTSLISSLIRNKGLKNAEKNLMQYTNLGRVSPQQIDLGRERASLRSNAALSDAAGRYYSQGATSASEAANIQNQARLGSQRTLGEGLSRSYQTEESENARLRGIADMANQQIMSDEAQMKLGVQSQFGAGARDNTWVDFAKSTGQSMAGYMAENDRMKRDYDYMQMAAPNMQMDYQTEFNKLTPYQQFLRRRGIGNVKPNIKVREGYGQQKA